MTKYLAGVLTVIAAGTMLIAYGLLTADSRAAQAYGRMTPASMAQDTGATDGIAVLDGARRAAPAARAYPVSYAPEPQPVARQATVARETPVRAIERAPKRDWKKTALFIGGSSAAGAGLGAIFGGKKGALIGAALGGGASTIYSVTKR